MSSQVEIGGLVEITVGVGCAADGGHLRRVSDLVCIGDYRLDFFLGARRKRHDGGEGYKLKRFFHRLNVMKELRFI